MAAPARFLLGWRVMNAYPPIPPLDSRQVKELVRQIRVLRHDYPGLNDHELCDEWAEVERWKISEGRATPFEPFLATPDWERAWHKAMAVAIRVGEQAARQKAMRQQAKEWKQDREPATPRQQRLVDKLVKEQAIEAPPADGRLSKLAASRLIRRGLGGN